MHLRPLALLAILLLAPAPATANRDGAYHREVAGPGSVVTTAATAAGASFCYDRLLPITACGLAGAGGAIIALDGAFGEPDLNEGGPDDPAARHVWAWGTCRVEARPGQLVQGWFSFICGVDRDDDGLVTSFDADSQDPDGFDDDFAGQVVEAPARAGEEEVCFRADGGGEPTWPYTGASWDDLAVFIATDEPSVDPDGLSYIVDVELHTSETYSNTPCASAFVGVGGHSHPFWYDTGDHRGAPCRSLTGQQPCVPLPPVLLGCLRDTNILCTEFQAVRQPAFECAHDLLGCVLPFD